MRKWLNFLVSNSSYHISHFFGWMFVFTRYTFLGKGEPCSNLFVYRMRNRVIVV